MGSINAQQVAIKVSEAIRKGELVNLGKIIKNNGYTKQTSLAPQRVTNTKSYKKALELESRPLIAGMQSEINRIKDAMSKRDLGTEEYRALVYGLDILTKNYQLLSGGATERQVFVLPSQAMKRYEIDESKPDTLPKDGSIEPLN